MGPPARQGESRARQSYRFPHRQFLGWIWLALGAGGFLFGGLELFAILRDPTGGYDLLPAFLLFVFLPFMLLSGVTGYTLLANKRAAKPLLLVVSSILVVPSGVGLLWGMASYVPLPLPLALGIYGIVVAHRVQSPPHARTQVNG